LKFNSTVREHSIDLMLLYSPHIRIPRVIDVIVIPEDETIVLQHPEHLGGYPSFHTEI
jgi:hypothetical protein